MPHPFNDQSVDPRGRVISFAQNGEDIVLWRALGHRTPGHYVDVGAHGPLFGSVTKLFHNHGWRGINIEPLPFLVEQLIADRPEDVTLGVGAGDQQSSVQMYYVPDDSQRTTMNAEIARHYREVEGRKVIEQTMQIERLDDILARHPLPRIDFLKVDAEGFEDRVFEGIDLTRWRPAMILAEQALIAPQSFPRRLADHGYVQTLFDGVNLFYVAEEVREEIAAQASYPACPLDNWIGYHHLAELNHERHLRETAEAEVHRMRSERLLRP